MQHKAGCCSALNAVILHIFSHVVRVMQPVCSLCESSVLDTDPVGWPWPRLWKTAQDGCRNDWEEPGRSEYGMMCVCVCMCANTAWMPVCPWLSVIVSYSERALCVWVCVSRPFSEPHGNQLSCIHYAGTQAVSQLAILLLWGTGGLGDEEHSTRDRERNGENGAEEWRFTVV